MAMAAQLIYVGKMLMFHSYVALPEVFFLVMFPGFFCWSHITKKSGGVLQYQQWDDGNGGGNGLGYSVKASEIMLKLSISIGV